MLNEAPNSKDVTRIANDVCLTTMGVQQFQWHRYSHHAEKQTYQI